jgi:hypothetical protein
LALGEGVGVLRQIYFADTQRAAERLAEQGLIGVGYKRSGAILDSGSPFVFLKMIGRIAAVLANANGQLNA